jgi:hypothetical protein
MFSPPNRLQVLPAYIRLGWKGLQLINTLAYLIIHKLITAVKSSVTLGPPGRCYKTFYNRNL